ncbi:MAG TPA: hypothetical protein VLT33_07190 [Labilithrix sp.]|nr:hypothetical protein [Labilithrix sp.]
MRRTSCLAVLLVCGPLLLLGAGAMAGGCGVSPAVTVVHLGPGQTSGPITGDPVKLKRGGQEGYAGMRGGFYVVRSAEDWHSAWSGGAEAAPFPATVDPSRSMLLLAVAESKESVALHIDKMVETASMVAVWVRDTRAGEGCTSRPDRPPFDGIVTPRIDKPVKFFVSEERAESCGEAPAVTVNCRVNDAPAWAPKVAGQPGDTVDCEMSAASRGKFALTDTALTLSELPAGSTAKLSYSKAPVRGAFSLDVFGTYTVHGEATDDSGRKSTAVASVEALPQKSRDVIVQLVWTNFDVSDDPDTFPRVKLRAVDEGPTPKTNKPCSVDEPNPGLCEVKTRSAFTYMKLKASSKRLPLEVLYVDERIEKGPLVCIKLYFEGARTGEACDRQHRNADERWTAGTLDMETGKLVDPATIADAGADAAPSKKPSGKK